MKLLSVVFVVPLIVSASAFVLPCNLQRLQHNKATLTHVVWIASSDQLAESPHANTDSHQAEAQLQTLQIVGNDPLGPGELAPATLVDGTPICENGYRVGIPPGVSHELRSFCDRIGITERFRGLLLTEQPLVPGTTVTTTLGGDAWNTQRPRTHWNNNMHWISPADEDAQEKYLQALGRGGFDKVLDGIGTYFGMDGIVAHHLTFIGVSHAVDSFTHADFIQTDGKAFNIIIPLILATDPPPELGWESDDREFYGWYNYEQDVAALLGDDAYHVTADCDYRKGNEFRMAATVYICDVNAENVSPILEMCTQAYPPDNDRERLVSQAGNHWGKGKSLPTTLARLS